MGALLAGQPARMGQIASLRRERRSNRRRSHHQRQQYLRSTEKIFHPQIPISDPKYDCRQNQLVEALQPVRN